MRKSKRHAAGHRFLHGICIMCGQSEKMYDLKCAPVPSKVVASYIRFDNYQKPLHSWHCLQDCLEELRKIEEKQAADSRKLAAVLATDNAWSLRDVLSKLIEATTHLLDDHSCDQHGHEQFRTAQKRAAELLAIIDQPGGEA